jgi:hypothetical protein
MSALRRCAAYSDSAVQETVNAAVVRDGDRLAAEFRNADPFHHLVIENFVTPQACAMLLADFPAFERGNARNENGELGSKSTRALTLTSKKRRVAY